MQGLGEHGNEFAFYSKDNGEPMCVCILNTMMLAIGWRIDGGKQEWNKRDRRLSQKFRSEIAVVCFI